MGGYMIELKNLEKTYRTSKGSVTAIKDINITINDGEIFGIIGLSGAGKSTLVRCINYLEASKQKSFLKQDRTSEWCFRALIFSHSET